MPKTKISEFSSTPANNTDIDSINIAEGCAPSGINDAIRELMAQLKDFQTGAVGDSFNGPVGSTTASTGAFTTLTTTGTINNLTVGRGAGAQTNSTALGVGVLAASNSGQVTAIGYNSLAANTTGRNVGVGLYCLTTNTTGTNNNAFGDSALYYNTTGGSNTAVGASALLNNTTASNNTAVGYQAGYSNTTGTSIDAFGRFALYGNTTGSYNSAIGSSTLQNNTTGINNVAVGYQSLLSNTTANSNTAVGFQAATSNTTGSANVAIGYLAGYSGTTGYDNVCVGAYSGRYTTTGIQNTFVGLDAGRDITTGSRNTILGHYNGNQGGLDIRTASNYIVLSDGDGNPRFYMQNNGYPYFTNMPAGAGTYPMKYNTTTGAVTADTSSRLVKENIEDSPYGLSELLALKPRKYFRVDDQKTEIGFVADEVVDTLPEFVPMVKKSFITGVEEDTEIIAGGVHYDKLVAVCVKAIQELKAEFDAYKASHP